MWGQVQGPESSGNETFLQRRQPDRYTTLNCSAVIGWSVGIPEVELTGSQPWTVYVMPQLIHMGAGVCPENTTVWPRPKCHGCVIVNLKSKYLPWTWTPHSYYVLLFISYLSHMPIRKSTNNSALLTSKAQSTTILPKKTKCDYSMQQGWGLFYAIVRLL